jgi:AraC family transcriptional regulator
MTDGDSYGKAFGRRLGADATSFASRALPRTLIGVTELRYRSPQNILSTPPIPEDAFLVAVHLELFEKYEYWENGKAARASTLLPGESIIYDIKRKPTFHLNSPFHSVHFYFPKAALDALADEANAPRIEGLHYTPAVSHNDRVMRGLAEALLPIFRNTHPPSRLFMDHLMLAAGHHVASEYGGMKPVRLPIAGGLSRQQERLSRDLIWENLGNDLSLSVLASACDLSVSQFSKAFRTTMGVPPHRWLVSQRISRAKSLLRDDLMSLAEIAVESGFADQSHFTRVFTASSGLSPGAWRRSIRD